jgi:hypothetical protein
MPYWEWMLRETPRVSPCLISNGSVNSAAKWPFYRYLSANYSIPAIENYRAVFFAVDLRVAQNCL